MFKKSFSITLILILISACSFDNKSGIWKNTNETSKIDDNVFKDFKTLKIKNKIFEDTIQIPSNFKFNISKPVNNSNWSDIFYNKSNNYDHFTYENKNELLFKSKKISSNEIDNFILFKNENIIKFNPTPPPSPHSEEDHEYIETFDKKLHELMDREEE